MKSRLAFSIPFSICIVSLILLAVCVAAVGADGFDWPRWRGPEGNGISRETDWDS